MGSFHLLCYTSGMKNWGKWLLFVGVVASSTLWLVVKPNISQAFDQNTNCDTKDLQQLEECISGFQEAYQQSVAATKPLESELQRLEEQMAGARAGIAGAKQKVEQLAVSIEQREEDLAVQYHLLSRRIAEQYKRNKTFSPFMTFLATQDAAQLTKDLVYRSSIQAQDHRLIQQIAEDISQLEADRDQLEADQIRLAALEEKLDEQADFFRAEIAGAKEFQEVLGEKIAALSARQQEILSEKSGTFQTTVGDVPPADDPASRPDYNPGFSPAFAAFSFGAPHFKGMSQYGAYGRARDNQNYEQILKAYYGSGIEIKDSNPDEQILVEGYNSYSLEEYAKRIYEVPNSWGDNGGMEALKAQAIAARSYALARVRSSGSICATESCQVFKPSPKGGNWEQAVNETRGKVLFANGQPFSAWYASTSGGYQESYSYNGYSTPGFWDAKDGRDGWTSQAYEKLAESPWFYKGWYKSRSGDNCGHSHPWLTSTEMADVLNAWVVLVKHGQSDDRVVPIGSCWTGNPYSIDELRNKASSLSIGYSGVSSASVTYANDGITANVVFQTDKDEVTINGNDFYKVFNLRAPGRIALKSGLFNIEQK